MKRRRHQHTIPENEINDEVEINKPDFKNFVHGTLIRFFYFCAVDSSLGYKTKVKTQVRGDEKHRLRVFGRISLLLARQSVANNRSFSPQYISYFKLHVNI